MTQLLDSCEKGKESMTSRMEMITTGLAISLAKMALSVSNFICAMNCKVWKNLCCPKTEYKSLLPSVFYSCFHHCTHNNGTELHILMSAFLVRECP